jgi:beta-glucosidase
MLSNSSAINAFLGVSTSQVVKDPNSTQVPELFYKSDYKTYEDLNDVTRDLSIEVMAEGMVLLKNDNNALPLNKGASLNLYGAGSYNFVYFGNGSSGYNLTDKDPEYDSCTNLKEGLEDGGDFEINEGLWNFYKTNKQYWQATNFSGNRKQTTKYTVKDANWAQITTPDRDKAADAGIMVISRNSGEDADRDLSYAELAESERDVLKNMKAL